MFREPRTEFSIDESKEIARMLGIDFEKQKFDVEQFRMGLNVELEHGMKSFETNITNDNPILTGKIALAHLKELPDYYTRLEAMEK